MAVSYKMTIFTLAIFLCVSQSTAFWWSSSEPSSPPAQPPNPYQGRIYAMYHPRYMPPQPTAPPTPAPVPETVPVPAIPIQVPLKAQLAPHANLHNVQLVRCLCPVNPDEMAMKEMYAPPVNGGPTNAEV